MTTDTTLWDRFTAIAAERPSHVAVHDSARTWTYAELQTRADAIAAMLDEAEASERVACLLSHGGDMVAGVLGVLAGGRAYVPLDPSHPFERTSFVLADSGARTLLCDAAHADYAARLADGMRVVRTDAATTGTPRRRPQPADLAYCLYTSGSTGRPKGVLQRHSNVVHLISAYCRRLEIGPSDVITLMSTFAFDAAVVDLFSVLLTGATLCPYDLRMRGLGDVPAMLVDRGVTVYHSTPTVWREVVLLAPTLSPAIRAVVLGGEEVRPDDVAKVRSACSPSTILVNGYGMTECSWALLHIVRAGDTIDRPTIPLGAPIDGVRVTLKTAFGPQRTLHGTGTISIESPYVALGYHNRPEETAASFPAPRTYLTSDLGRLLPGGAIEFAGRHAHQVKIRGFRIDLREIESVLKTHTSLREAAAAVHDGPRGPELVAYVVAREGMSALDTNAVRDYLATQLPDYMLPAVTVALPTLPKGATGKLDRNALPPPDASAFTRAEYVPPSTATELRLAEIWSSLLAADRIGLHDDFFRLGGHSLLMIKLVTAIESALGVRVPVRDVFEHPTLGKLAAYVDQVAPAPSATPARVAYQTTSVTEARATTPQEYFWRLDRDDHDPASYQTFKVLRLFGSLDVDAFGRAYRELARYHSIYRTGYRERGAALYQFVRPADDMSFELELVDRSSSTPRSQTELHAELETAVAELTARDYDLGSGEGLLRARLIRLSSDEHALVLMSHHIVSDGATALVFQQQLLDAYNRALAGKTTLLTSQPLHYIDYAHARERWSASSAGHANAAFWTDYLRDAPAVQLEGDFPRGPIDAHRDAVARGVTADLSHPPEHMLLPESLYTSVTELARDARTTPYSVFMAAFAWLARERSGQDQLAIQTTYSPRGEDPALEQIHGCLTMWTLVRMSFAGATSVRAALANARASIATVQDHGAPADFYGSVPHGLRRLVLNYLPARRGPRASTANATAVQTDLRIEVYPWRFPTWKRTWDLHLTLADTGRTASLHWTGLSTLFRKETVHALLERYVEILATATAR